VWWRLWRKDKKKRIIFFLFSPRLTKIKIDDEHHPAAPRLLFCGGED
jgi:hypothetical protein